MRGSAYLRQDVRGSGAAAAEGPNDAHARLLSEKREFRLHLLDHLVLVFPGLALWEGHVWEQLLEEASGTLQRRAQEDGRGYRFHRHSYCYRYRYR